ncbi:MAG TPA: GGDEF domain-containing protein, partial [Pyrinomonadaceae bacterium]|nr:GGDEF domain-containing protein [Pyrinomonadaceae bacterium]
AFLLDADCAQALVAAERVRAAIEEHAFSSTRHGTPAAAAEENRTLRITISIGVAAYPDDARDPIELIELADTALYHAKQSGRNRVSAFCFAPDEGTAARELRPRNASPRNE